MSATPDSARALVELRELAALTSDEQGAQRIAWTPTWAAARAWLRERLAELDDVAVQVDAAGNLWATLPGESARSVVLGGHLDSVPNGGWLDGALGTIGSLAALRAFAAAPRRPLTIRLVDWADEEGARFGRSLLGSSACAGTLDPAGVRDLTDRDGVRLADALAAHGVDVERMRDAGAELRDVAAYLELHIEQGPVLERLGLPLGVVLGTFGVERHRVRFSGAHAHAGATPMDARRDAFLAAARSALALRDEAARRDDVRATTGSVTVVPGIVTAFNGAAELSVDQRALEAAELAALLAHAREASEQIAAEEGCSVAWERLLAIEPVPFDGELMALADAVVAEVAGVSHRLPSGPLHDAAEMARVLPAAMLFVRSIGGVSHTKEEDSSEADVELSIRALHELAVRTATLAEHGTAVAPNP
ncbi:MAG TPA: Zn-dependent hydrolase [Conexibacter sp.]|nr:Zn-dependent hydrolase [Conexibacter sp.]